MPQREKFNVALELLTSVRVVETSWGMHSLSFVVEAGSKAPI